MDAELGHWAESYSNFYSPKDDEDPSAGFFGIGCGLYGSSLSTDPADIMGLVQSTPVGYPHAGAFGGMSSAPNALYVHQGNMSANQRQQANQPLYIDTQLSFNQIDDSEGSTASSSSLRQGLQTPYLQLYSWPQPPVHILSPQSASAESGSLMPDPEKMSPLPASPLSLSQYSPAYETDVLDSPTSPFTMEPDIVTQSPMPHILEWKRIIEICGTKDFVPQVVYQPYTEADRKRYIRDVVLQETIFFCVEDSHELGIPLDDALKQRLKHLKDKDDLMFVGCGPSVSIRIQWPGYQPWSKQIPTMDFKTPKGPITRAKLAKNIATCIRRFQEYVQNKPMEAESDKRWKVGNCHIKVEDLILVSLHHVSKGSWQPQLRLRLPPPVTTFPFEFLPPS
ncbi:hypothetical protein V8E55_005597 [Tylopilus felleus]